MPVGELKSRFSDVIEAIKKGEFVDDFEMTTEELVGV